MLHAAPAQKLAQSSYCAGCHKMQAKDWHTTWHARSHMSKNPLYKKALEMIARTEYRSVDSVAITCAKCHNPRIGIKKVNKKFILAKAFGLKSSSVERVERALSSPHIKEGINCIVCHNVDSIDPSTDLRKRGFDAVHWTKGDLIVGPYETHRSDRYHHSASRPYFKEQINTLCLVCHYGGENAHHLAVYTTGIEYLDANASKKCADCHMSPHFSGVIAPNVHPSGTKIERRALRRHRFAGIRNSDIGTEAFTLTPTIERGKLRITLHNRTPHRFPTGFGGREIELELRFMGDEGTISTQKHIFSARFVDASGAQTLPYLATRIASDTRLRPNETRSLSFSLPKGARSVSIMVRYRLVNTTLKEALGIDDPVFTRAYNLFKKTIKVK